MKILFITSAHNSLSQRAWLELTERGHVLAVQIASSDAAMTEAVVRHRPDLFICPMLMRAVPEDI